MTGLPLVLVIAIRGAAAMILFAILGALWAIQVIILGSLLAASLTDRHLAQGMGIANSLNRGVVGLSVGLAGFTAQHISPVTIDSARGFFIACRCGGDFYFVDKNACRILNSELYPHHLWRCVTGGPRFPGRQRLRAGYEPWRSAGSTIAAQLRDLLDG